MREFSSNSGNHAFNDEIRESVKEGIVTKSIEVLRRNGMPDEQVKEKMMASFSLDEKTVDTLMYE